MNAEPDPWDRDKFGRVLYPGLQAVLMRYARGLLASGFTQAREKPWLFIRHTPIGPVFANMGSSAVIPIWEDPSPLIHHELKGPRWLQRKHLAMILWELEANEVPYRFSFYATSEPGGLWFPMPDKEPIEFNDSGFEGADGWCKRCGAELLTGDLYCAECSLKVEEALRVPCAACRDLFLPEHTIVHHTSYEPELTVRVCRSCHLRIHRSNDFPSLKPVDARR